MSHWQPGTPIQDGRYVIGKVLGYGGAGVTYCAQERPSKEWVAIKTLNALMQTRSDFAKHQERFLQEAFRLAKCNHKHIIRVDNICQEGFLWCMVMEFVTGGNLRQYAQSRHGLPEAEALYYIHQIGSALHYVHQQGFLHRDVKPANIMLRPKLREAVLIDFGLAREFVQDEIDTHTNSRTESFAPLEQYEKRAKRGAYTDVYALAATLYFLLTLQVPFPAPFRLQGATLIPPKQHNPKIGDRLNAAILQGMELQAGDRPASIPDWLVLLSRPKASVPSPAPETKPEVKTANPLPKPTIAVPLTPTPSSITLPGLPPTNIQAKTKIPPSHLPANPIISELGIDYTSLKTLISQVKLREADQETARLLLTLAQREPAGWLDKIHVENLPLQDLHLIDQLWSQGSNGRFGFQSQKNIYQKLGGTLEHQSSTWKSFCARVGWRQNNRMVPYKDLTFTLWAPEGHLPMMGQQIWGFVGWFSVLCHRLDSQS